MHMESLVNVEYLRINKENVNWKELSKTHLLNIDNIREFKDYVDWNSISKNYKFTEEELIEFSSYINWKIVLKHQDIPYNILRKYQDYLDWDLVSAYQKLPLTIIEEFKDKLNLFYIYTYQDLPQDYELQLSKELFKNKTLKKLTRETSILTANSLSFIHNLMPFNFMGYYNGFSRDIINPTGIKGPLFKHYDYFDETNVSYKMSITQKKLNKIIYKKFYNKDVF